MKPKKSNTVMYSIIGFVSLLLFLSVSLAIGLTIDDVALVESAQEIKDVEKYNLFMECFEKRTANPFKDIHWSGTVLKALLTGTFIWLIAVMYFITSKKNFIAGKEYGTAKWSLPKVLKKLKAEYLMRQELKRAKRIKYPIVRFFAKRKVVKECKKNNAELLSLELHRCELWYSEALTFEKTPRQKLRKEYKKKKKDIETKSRIRLRCALEEAWKPYKLKAEYKRELEGIEQQYQTGLAFDTKSQKTQAQKKAKRKYKSELRGFYTGKISAEKIKKKYENADAIFTKTEQISIHNYVLNNNTLILGGSGSGKTRSFVLPNVLQAHSSFVITDPKGEILEKAGTFLETVAGYKIHVLNLDDKLNSDGYNPFVYIHPERAGYEGRVLTLIETIIVNTEGGEKKSPIDPFWPMAERLFLQSIFFFTCDGFPSEERNMNTVLSLIAMLEIGEEQDDLDSDLDYFVDIFAELNGEEHIGVQQYREFRSKASGKTAKSIVISAVARLAPFRVPDVKRIFSYDTMCIDRLGEEKTAIFVVVPPTDPTFNFIAGMMFTQMFQELQYCATQVHKHEGQKLPVPVRFILDEYANTCVIPQFTKILAYARSFGIGIVTVLQSLEQIKALHREEWGVIVDNCNTILFLGSITHKETLEYMAALLGNGTYDKRTSGKTLGRNRSHSQNVDVIGRGLMDASEIRKLPKTDCLLIVGGKDPFYSEKYDYTKHPNYKYTSDANSAFSYEYTPPGMLTSDEEIPHGEEFDGHRRAASIITEIENGFDEIHTEFNEEVLLKRLVQDFEYLIPIEDESLREELSEEELMSLLEFKIEDKKINDMVFNISEKIQKANDAVSKHMEENELIFISEPIEVAKVVVRSGENLAPIRNELLENESFEEADEYTFDTVDEENVDNDIGDLSSMIAELSKILESE